jgi:small subunit ribosomal protein S20
MVTSRTGRLTPAALRPQPICRTPSARSPVESIEDLHVANIASQIKRNRQNEKRRLRNKSVRAELRTRTKNAIAAAEIGAEDNVEQLRLAVKRIDKAAARGVIHKNTAANHKSRLVRRVAALEAAIAGEAEPEAQAE